MNFSASWKSTWPIGFLGLSSIGSEPRIRSENGEVFRQAEGYAHPGHRIIDISVVPLDPPDDGWDTAAAAATAFAQGHLLATTLYSAPSGSHGRRSFLSRVVDACWNPHLPEECVVLLDDGDFYWMRPNSGCAVRIRSPGGDCGRWLRCEFGGKPWLLFVASSVAVTMVDLRSRNGSGRSTLARIEDPCSYMEVHSMVKDQFIAFSRASGDDFLFSVATEHHLFVYDSRQPLIPVLRWNHGLNHPCYVAVHPLRELRPSEQFRWASESGFAVIAGSFCNSEFSVFCCGPKEQGDSNRSRILTLYAWELPSDLCVLDRRCSSVDALVNEEFLKEELPAGSDRWLSEELVVGFSILPEAAFSVPSKLEDPGGFSLLRLLSSGRLELQQYCFIKNLQFPLVPWNGNEDAPVTRHDFLNFKFLSAYLTGNLSKTMIMEMQNPGAELMKSKLAIDDRGLQEIIDREFCRTSPSVLDCITDVGIPSSIHEVASRRALCSLQRNLLHLAFSRFSDLFTERKHSTIEFPEVSSSPSFFLRKPLGRTSKGHLRVLPADRLVGPVLPLPVLLSLQRMEDDGYVNNEEEEEEEDLMATQCSMILDRVFPEISIASSQVLQEENPFQVHEPRACLPGETRSFAKEQGETHQEHQEFSSAAMKDDKFSIFVWLQPGPETLGMSADLAPVKLDFDPPGIRLSHNERKIFSSLKRQFSRWQSSWADQDLPRSSKFSKRM
ncbi:unnamed protein product [Spirodela intermedia]|uniref:Uncharacterized protein n=1 Tax=Spirodela intermedia TaxID=51605 RepID=A0A7I8IJ90_SPIIN|nr:unnamed protein product [Spirodela intermedia]CAA6657946.1 unnamed protein product [Spirodela intermedia]